MPWLKPHGAFGPWHSSPIWFPVVVPEVSAQREAYKGALQMARRIVKERRGGMLVVSGTGAAYDAQARSPNRKFRLNHENPLEGCSKVSLGRIFCDGGGELVSCMVSHQCSFLGTYDDPKVFGTARLPTLRGISDFLLLWIHKEVRKRDYPSRKSLHPHYFFNKSR